MPYHLRFFPASTDPLRLVSRNEGADWGDETGEICFPSSDKMREVAAAMIGYADSHDQAVSRHGSLPGQSHELAQPTTAKETSE
jgi:hypothetical protein